MLTCGNDKSVSNRKGELAMSSSEANSGSIPAGARIGHVHLKVANLDRAIHFYHDLMGFDLLMRFGDQAAFLSAGGYHHHIGLNTWESAGGTPPALGTTGLYHFAINYPERRDLAVALKRLLDGGWSIDGASDHGTHEAIYLHDPDHNGLELAWDRPPAAWLDAEGRVIFNRKSLDFASLLAELDSGDGEGDAASYVKALAVYT